MEMSNFKTDMELSDAVDIVILSNGPGEVTTWVRPVVKALRQQLGEDRSKVRLSLVLSPCPNASGREAAIARRFPELDRVQEARHFWPFLLLGQTAEQWDWRDRGVVLFLGGDQVYPILIGKRLGYSTVIYGEWDTRWHRWGDRYGVMNASLIQKAPGAYAHKFTVVGDLMADAAEGLESDSTDSGEAHAAAPVIGMLPGSKPLKLAQGVPLCLAIAHHIHRQSPEVQFLIPVAPTLDLDTLARFARAATNPVLLEMGGIEAKLVHTEPPRLVISDTLFIELRTEVPAYDPLRRCQLCITTVGANTAELGSLAVPMLVLIPTQRLEAMKAWDGIPGLLANLPGVGDAIARLINRRFLRNRRLLAWPNIWAGEEIVPELVGEIWPEAIAQRILDYLRHPEALQQMRDRLRQVRGKPGAARQLAQLVVDALGPQGKF